MFLRLRILLTAAVLTLAVLPGPASAGGFLTERPTSCEPGYTIVEEICYREVCKKVCHIIPDIRKVRVPCYDIHCVDICKLRCGVGCDCCDENQRQHGPPPKGCGRIREVRRLVKKEIEEEIPIYRCEVENVVEQVPYKVYRKVPCGTIEGDPK